MSKSQRRPGTGSKRERSPGRWEIKYEAGVDPTTSQRRTRTETVRGNASDAEKVLRARLAAVDKGEDVAPNKMTVKELIEGRIEIWQGLGSIRQGTVEYRTEIHNAWIRPHLGEIPVQKLTPQHVERWHATLRSSGSAKGRGGLSARSCQAAHKLLVQALNDAVKHNLVLRNVAAVQGGPKGKVKEIEILQVDKDNDVDEVDDLLTGLQGQEFYDEVVTTLYTGLRRAELLALPWRHVKLDQKLLEVRVALEETRAHGVQLKETKTESGLRDISLPEIVVDLLRKRRVAQLEQRAAAGLGKMSEGALVFPAPEGGYYRPTHFSVRWRRAVRRLKLPAVTWHGLRHSHASMLIASKSVDIVTISKRLGHKSADITLKVYAHLFRTDDREAAAAIDRMLAAK